MRLLPYVPKTDCASSGVVILIEVGDAAFAHGGFPIHWPIEPITAQMSLRYSVAVALLDGAALIKQFVHARIEADDVLNSPPTPFHLGRVKSSTSALTRSFWRLRGNRLVLVSSAIPWRLAQNSSDRTSGFELCP